MIQSLIVALIVCAAFCYSAWSFLPRAVKRRLAARLSSRAARMGVDVHAASAIERRLAGAGGCSDCDRCGQCAPSLRAGGPTVVAMPASRRYTQH